MSNKWRRPPRNTGLPTTTSNPQFSGQLQLTATQTFYAGPVVHPEIAEQWEAVLPGSADRIMTQFENQSTHRQALETKQVGWNNIKEVLGMVLAFLIFITSVAGGIYLISLGHGTEGLVAIIAALVIPGALFIAGRRGAMAELRKKKELVQNPSVNNQQIQKPN